MKKDYTLNTQATRTNGARVVSMDGLVKFNGLLINREKVEGTMRETVFVKYLVWTGDEVNIPEGWTQVKGGYVQKGDKHWIPREGGGVFVKCPVGGEVGDALLVIRKIGGSK